jgi:hypothetical protein
MCAHSSYASYDRLRVVVRSHITGAAFPVTLCVSSQLTLIALRRTIEAAIAKTAAFPFFFVDRLYDGRRQRVDDMTACNEFRRVGTLLGASSSPRSLLLYITGTDRLTFYGRAI